MDLQSLLPGSAGEIKAGVLGALHEQDCSVELQLQWPVPGGRCRGAMAWLTSTMGGISCCCYK